MAGERNVKQSVRTKRKKRGGERKKKERKRKRRKDREVSATKMVKINEKEILNRMFSIDENTKTIPILRNLQFIFQKITILKKKKQTNFNINFRIFRDNFAPKLSENNVKPNPTISLYNFFFFFTKFSRQDRKLNEYFVLK